MDGIDFIIEQVREPIRRVAESFANVRAVYIFGSQFRGDARPDSDVDLGVLYATPQTLETTLRIEMVPRFC